MSLTDWISKTTSDLKTELQMLTMLGEILNPIYEENAICTCPDCNGSGKMSSNEDLSPSEAFKVENLPCMTCGGYGLLKIKLDLKEIFDKNSQDE